MTEEQKRACEDVKKAIERANNLGVLVVADIADQKLYAIDDAEDDIFIRNATRDKGADIDEKEHDKILSEGFVLDEMLCYVDDFSFLQKLKFNYKNI